MGVVSCGVYNAKGATTCCEGDLLSAEHTDTTLSTIYVSTSHGSK